MRRDVIALVLLAMSGATAATVELRVTRQGKPAVGVECWFIPLAESGAVAYGGTTAAGTSDRRGICRVDGLDPGPYRLAVPLADGGRVEHAFTVTGPEPTTGWVRLPGPAAPTALDLTGPPAAPAGSTVTLTLRATGTDHRTLPPGLKATVTTDAGRLTAGGRSGGGVTVPLSELGNEVRLKSTAPGPVKVTAKYGELEATAEVLFHGPAAGLTVALGPAEPAGAIAQPVPGAPIPLLIAATDAGGRPVTGLPFKLWYRPLPDGVDHLVQGVTGTSGTALVLGKVTEGQDRYRATVRHGRLVTSREFEVTAPFRPWIETRLEWDGWAGELTVQLHGGKLDDDSIELEVTPESRAVLLDYLDEPVSKVEVDGDGAASVAVLRLAPGPLTITARATGWEPGQRFDGFPSVPPAPADDPRLPAVVPNYAEIEPAEWPAVAEPNGDLPLVVRRAGPGWVYRYGPSVADRLLALGDELASPLLARDGHLVYARLDGRDIKITRHGLALGLTEEETITPTHPFFRWGILRVWDLGDDGRILITVREPGQRVGVWVLGGDDGEEPAAVGWDAVREAVLIPGGVAIRGVLEGRPVERWLAR